MKNKIIITSSIISCLALLFMGCQTESKPKDPVARDACINNLRQIFAAEQEWALENNKTNNETPTWADLKGRYIRDIPVCPAGGSYTLSPIDGYPKCSVAGHELPPNYGRKQP